MDDWTTRLIQDVMLKTPLTDPKKTPDVSFLYVDVSGVSNKTLEITTSEELLGKDAPSRARRIVSAGDVIFATVRPTLRRIAIVPDYLDGQVVSTGYFVFKPTPEIFNRFLFYYLQTQSFMGKMESLQSGASYPAVNDTQVKGQSISYPPIPEQQGIVAILDQAFADIEKARANAEKNLKNARELFDSYLNRAFDENKTNWPIMDLGQIAEVKGGKRLPKGYRPTIEKTKYPYVRVADFDNKGSVNLVGMRYISEEVHNKIKRYTISSKDVFITIVGATIGKSGIVPKELNGANLTENACKLVLGSNMSNKFIYYFTITKTFYEQVGLNTRTAAQPKLALERLKTINLAIPPIDVQETLSAKFNTVWLETQRLDMIYQRKIASLDELKKSLLQKAFSGELTKSKGIAA